MQATLRCACENKSKLVHWLLEHNRRQSADFTSQEQVSNRSEYRSRHPTEIVALKCMDGRLNLPVITDLPPGIIQPFRNLGGEFRLGWHPFQRELYEWMRYAHHKGRDCLVIVTYHFSASDPNLGCKGFNYDTDAARKAAMNLAKDLRRSCAKSFVPLYAIVVGIETDSDTLIFHGYDGTPLSMADCRGWSGEELFGALEEMYPKMSRRVIKDILPLIKGNVSRIATLSREPRREGDVYHKERVLIVGRGVDWLHTHNLALIVGPFSYNLRTPVLKAGEILLDNLRSGRIDPSEGIVLMASALHREVELGIEAEFAAFKAMELEREALRILYSDLPELVPHLSLLVGTTDMSTRFFRDLTPEFEKSVA